jgi:cytoskeletal protein CcmA (bactofilin family)
VAADATIAGSAVSIAAPVGGDARIAAGDINISAPIGGDALFAAGRIVVTDKASIAGDALFGAGDITIDGTLAGKTKLSGEKITINGPVTGDITVYAQSLTFGKNAQVTGAVRYFGPQEATVVAGASVPTITYEMVKNPMADKGDKKADGAAIFGFLSFFFVVKLIAWMALAFLLYKLFPRTAERMVASVQTKFWSNAGIGFLALVCVPLIALVLLVTFVGYSIAVVTMLAYITLLFLATPLVVLTVGAWVYGKLAKKSVTALGWQAVVIGAVLVVLVKLIPFIGGLVVFVITCAAFGVYLRKLFWISKEQHLPPADTIVVEEVTVTTV